MPLLTSFLDYDKWNRDRVAAEMTQTDIAQKARCGRSYVNHFMAGRRRSLRTWHRMAKALGKTVEDYYRPKRKR